MTSTDDVDQEYQNHLSNIEKAKAILSEAGYVVSPRPLEWREFSVLVTVKVQSRTYSEADFRRFVEDKFEHVDGAYLAQVSEKEVHAVGKIIVKQYSRIVRKDAEDDK